jgi:hypothetical protein
MKPFLCLSAMTLALAACGSSSSPAADAGTTPIEETDGASLSNDASPSSGTDASSEVKDAGTPPAEASTGTPTLGIGDPCTDDSQCPSLGHGPGTCMKSWPGGACTVPGCGQCPGDDSWCDYYQGQTYCVPSCSIGNVACTRAGYTCDGAGCVPTTDAGDGG